MSNSQLEIQDLTVTFAHRRVAEPLRAVDGVSFGIPEAETVALVGESGSGKSTIGNAILGLVPIDSGAVSFQGRQIANSETVARAEISKHIQVVFQDPYGSLNPLRTIEQILIEPLMAHRKMSKTEMKTAVAEMLERVSLPRTAAAKYPAHFSGGQRQRIAIARAMITSPDVVICDEPVSSLDLSVQAQIINLLSDLQERHGLSYLFISHDIAVVRRIADQIVVLYRGLVVEKGSAVDVCSGPRHPYTRALFLAAPVASPKVQRSRARRRREWVKGGDEVAASTSGCPFAPRCRFAIGRCFEERPELRPTDRGSLVACHRYEELPDLPAEQLWPGAPA